MNGAVSRKRTAVADVIPEQHRSIFPFSAFNAVQSNCMEAFTSADNLVVSAPTGSGKTVLFELAILREIMKAKGKQGKAVYVAPIKALCAEKAAEWSKTFKELSVCLLTGDDDDIVFSSDAFAQASIIVTTPEKFDSMTRSHKGALEQSLIATVALLLVDEIHHLGDGRGCTLEAIIARIRFTRDALSSAGSFSASSMPVSTLRILAVSATIPNLMQVARWLGVPQTSENCKAFGNEYRAVPLTYKVIGYTSRNKWKLNDVLFKKTFDVVTRFGSSKPSLLFCPTRKGCVDAAKAFLADMEKKRPNNARGNYLTSNLTQAERTALIDGSTTVADKDNASLIPHGISIHHAAISSDDRDIIEDLFRRQILRAIFCTSTLAAGVNLPAHLVVIVGTQQYARHGVGGSGSMVQVDKNLCVQAMGRAGRPDWDTDGKAVIMTERENIGMYEQLVRGQLERVVSQLEKKIAEHLNAEIYRGVIVDVPSAVNWIRSTFLYAQQKDVLELSVLEDKTKTIVLNILKDLAAYGLISYDGYLVEPLTGSQLMAQFFMSFETMKTIVSQANDVTSEADVLQLIGKTLDLTGDLFLRRQEKNVLNDISPQLRFPLRGGKIKTVAEKVNLLLQLSMSPNSDSLIGKQFSLKMEVEKVAQIGVRVAKTLSSYLFSCEKERSRAFSSTLASLRVSRALRVGTWWDGGSVVMQLDGIGPVQVKKLMCVYVQSLQQLADLEPRFIEKTLTRTIPYGDMLLKSLAETIPKIVAHVEQIGFPVVGEAKNALFFRIHVELSSWWPQSLGLEAQRNKMVFKDFHHKGFLLVGSHGRSVECFEQFELGADSNSRESFDVEIQLAGERWIDFLVGPDDFVGADFHHRVHVSPAGVSNVNPPVKPLPLAKLFRAKEVQEDANADDEFLDLTNDKSQSPPKAKAERRRRTSPSPKAILEKARPFVSSLPVKRLRDDSSSSVANCNFEGARLSGFSVPQTETAHVPFAISGQSSGRDEYDDIFELLAKEMDADRVGTVCRDVGTDDGLSEENDDNNQAFQKTPGSEMLPLKRSKNKKSV